MLRIGGPGGGMTPEQLKYFDHIVASGGGVQPGDSAEVIKQKLADYNSALRRLHEFNGGHGPIQYAQVPEGGYAGHYEIDPDQLDGTIKEWQDIFHGLTNDQREIDAIRHVQAPAPDQFASEAQAQSLRDFGERMHKRNQDMIAYANMYLHELAKTKEQYLAQERNAQGLMRKQMGNA